jgi:uncharacterized protein involved in outer membrane biogenesis
MDTSAPRQADSKPTRWSNVWKAAIVVLVAMVGTVAVCEIAGWPFLAGPVQRMLADTLKRDVQLSDAAGTGASSVGRPSIRFLGSLRVAVPALQIGAPAWSKQPYFLRAEGASMRLTYPALWRAKQGNALDIASLKADHLVVHAERQDDGQASWTFGNPDAAPAKTATPIPTVHELRVQKGELSYVDAILKADILAQLQLAEGDEVRKDPRPLPTAVQGLIASAKGTYGDVKVSADLRSAGATPLLDTGSHAAATPVVLSLNAGKASLSFNGTVTDVLKLTGMNGSFRVTGPSLAAAGDPLGVTLPTTPPFVLAGRIKKDGDVWNVVADDATVGSSKLTAALTFDTRPAVPILSGRVQGARLLLADLAPAIGGEPGAPSAPPTPPKDPNAVRTPKKARVLPDREFDLPSLRAMNANVLLAFDRVELGSLFAQPLQPLKAHLMLNGGKLQISDLVARTADGNLAGNIGLDGTGVVALWDADVRWSGVTLETWLKQDRGGAPPYIAGRLVGHAKLKGEGRSTAQILGTLNGSATTWLRNGKLSHLAMEAAGIDIAQALGVFVSGDKQLPVTCAVADFQADKGVLTPRALVVDTKDSTVWVDGSLSLLNESMDLRAVVSPKDFSLMSLRTPIHVNGTFGSPGISLEKKPLARKLGLAALLAFVNPFAAVIPLIDTGSEDGKDVGCPELLARARRSAGQEVVAP